MALLGFITFASADGNPDRSLSATAAGPGFGRVSPDGEWLALVSDESLTGQVTNGHYEMYMYSLKDDRLTCISCPSGPATSDASVVPGVTSGTPALTNIGIRPQFLSDKGQVFFSTAEALLPQDTNGVADVYEYDAESETLRLLSPGTGSNPTTFADASANGEDVFVQTRQQLVSEDHDPLVDLYDVRLGGGFPAPSVPAGCVADECQASPTVPGFAPPASIGFAGAGNQQAVVSKPAAKGQSNARKLARALKACKRKRGRLRRRKCEAQAHRHYGKNAKSSRGSK